MNELGSASVSGTSRVSPKEYDVLCGSGRECYEHSGNVRFRDVVSGWQRAYVKAERKIDKSKVVQKIIRDVLAPGTRFLKKHPIYCYWFVAPHQSKVQRDKVSHFLREMTRVSSENAEDHQLDDDAELLGNDLAEFQQHERQLQQQHQWHQQDLGQERLKADIGNLITLAVNSQRVEETSKSHNTSQSVEQNSFPKSSHLSQSQQDLLFVLGEEGFKIRSIQEMAKEPVIDLGKTPSTMKLCSLLASGASGENAAPGRSSSELRFECFRGNNKSATSGLEGRDSTNGIYLQSIVQQPSEQETLILQGECKYHHPKVQQQQPFVPQEQSISNVEYQQRHQNDAAAVTASVATLPKLETLLMQEATKAVDDLANNEDTLRYLMSWLEEEEVALAVSASAASTAVTCRGGDRPRRRNSFFM